MKWGTCPTAVGSHPPEFPPPQPPRGAPENSVGKSGKTKIKNSEVITPSSNKYQDMNFDTSYPHSLQEEKKKKKRFGFGNQLSRCTASLFRRGTSAEKLGGEARMLDTV